MNESAANIFKAFDLWSRGWRGYERAAVRGQYFTRYSSFGDLDNYAQAASGGR